MSFPMIVAGPALLADSSSIRWRRPGDCRRRDASLDRTRFPSSHQVFAQLCSSFDRECNCPRRGGRHGDRTEGNCHRRLDSCQRGCAPSQSALFRANSSPGNRCRSEKGVLDVAADQKATAHRLGNVRRPSGKREDGRFKKLLLKRSISVLHISRRIPLP